MAGPARSSLFTLLVGACQQEGGGMVTCSLPSLFLKKTEEERNRDTNDNHNLTPPVRHVDRDEFCVTYDHITDLSVGVGFRCLTPSHCEFRKNIYGKPYRLIVDSYYIKVLVEPSLDAKISGLYIGIDNSSQLDGRCCEFGGRSVYVYNTSIGEGRGGKGRVKMVIINVEFQEFSL